MGSRRRAKVIEEGKTTERRIPIHRIGWRTHEILLKGGHGVESLQEDTRACGAWSTVAADIYIERAEGACFRVREHAGDR